MDVTMQLQKCYKIIKIVVQGFTSYL